MLVLWNLLLEEHSRHHRNDIRKKEKQLPGEGAGVTNCFGSINKG